MSADDLELARRFLEAVESAAETGDREGIYDQVMGGLRHLREGGVEWNALTTIHGANAEHGREVYRFLRDECGARFVQFIPIIERVAEADGDGSVPWSSWRDRPLYTQEGTHITNRSVTAKQYGRFLIDVFEEWVRRDVGEVYVQMFDVALANWVGEPPGLCIHSETCGLALALEHTGDLYSCDHFVEPKHKLGNITMTHMLELVSSPPRPRSRGSTPTKTPAGAATIPVAAARAASGSTAMGMKAERRISAQVTRSTWPSSSCSS